ncbi:hypothetical protein ES702_00489 [subsurface metagenome]
MFLKKCRDCGLEAHTKEELKLFDKNVSCCKKCKSKWYRNHYRKIKSGEFKRKDDFSRPILRKCVDCGLEAKTKEDLQIFVKNIMKRYGRNNLCKKCSNKRQKERNTKKVIDLSGPIFRKCRTCGLEAHNKEELELFIKVKSSLYGRANICRKCANEQARKKTAEIRLIVLKHYGGDPPKCACCGEDHIEFLTIDHIKGGGNRHEKELRKEGYATVAYWLYKKHFPEGFRVLCWNCNASLGIYGYCPHQKKKGD